ncbi:unnamed protein product [Bemisia tabaci]|uniref:Odorant receptor n=1 Tax=Bemisia tabaci TaxID=7038 RepID=A0A9P0G2X3_BEMTA|nr:unnamed protein product [Bemisia tabaci]
MTDSGAKIKTTEELLVLKTARKFKRLLEFFFPPKNSQNIWPLVPFIILHHFIQTLFMIMPLLETKNTQYLTVTATLARKIHSIISPLIYINLAVWWQKRDVLVEFTQNLNNILLDDQFPLPASLRTSIITDLESRHRLMVLSVTPVTQIMVLFYFLPPIVTFFLNPSPSRQLNLPLGIPNPLSFLGFTPNDVTRALVYFCISVSIATQFYVIHIGTLLVFITVDALKTAFFISGISFETIGHDDFSQREQFVSAITHHQRLFRLSSKLKEVIEPILEVALTGAMTYIVIGELAIIQAEDVAMRIYFNEHCVGRKIEFAQYFPFMIMRSNKPVKFRIYKCWAITYENSVKYTQLMYSFYIVLNSATSKYNKNMHLHSVTNHQG